MGGVRQPSSRYGNRQNEIEKRYGWPRQRTCETHKEPESGFTSWSLRYSQPASDERSAETGEQSVHFAQVQAFKEDGDPVCAEIKSDEMDFRLSSLPTIRTGVAETVPV